MPTWIETKQEIDRRKGDYDGVRRERIKKVETITGRPLIVYASAFLEKEKVQASKGDVVIDAHDPIAFDEVITPIQGQDLDVLIHSPGGSAEAAEGIVTLLRSRFQNIRFIIPHMAKSAATMVCCAGDELVMDERSELGPIDPQMQLLRADSQVVSAPAQAILKQFDMAKESLINNPKEIAAWLPILHTFGPSLLRECETANELSQRLVEMWLKQYMFAGENDGDSYAKEAALYLADSSIHLSHGRRIGIEQLKNLHFKIKDLREDLILRDAVWNLYHALNWTFQDTVALKIVETCHDTAYIRQLLIQRNPPFPPDGDNSKLSKPIPQQSQSKTARKRH